MKSIPEIEDRLLSDEYFSDPYPLFAELRNRAPVYWSDKLSSWLVTRCADCEDMIGDSSTFSSYGRVAYLLDQLPDDMQEEIEPLRKHYAVGLAHSDPPMHTRLRNALKELINPITARARAESIREQVVGLIERIESGLRFDYIADFAYPLPATVVADVLGAPREDIGKFKAWADDIAGLFEYGGKMSPDAARNGVRSLSEIRKYVIDLLELNNNSTAPTVVAALANPEDRFAALSEQEIISTLVTLFVAGHETTTNHLGMVMKTLIDRPDLAADLRENPSLIQGAVREFLRHEAVVPRAWRMATRDVEFKGQTIRKGQMVMAMLGSANRDPDAFDRPDSIDIRRPTKRNLTFGSGIHICLGSPLARTESTIVIEEVLGRFDKLEHADGNFAWRRDMALRGLKALPVKFRAA